MHSAYILIIILVLTLALFIWGVFRYDVVALLTLLSLVITGTIPMNQTFMGFANPAVITVCCVMVLTSAISQSGILEYFVKKIVTLSQKPMVLLSILCFVSAILSAFMNNVGALALMMPIAIQTARKTELSVSLVLMPISFASVLGGLTTAIGTPPNLLISAYREAITGQPFSLFDFTPVGFWVAIIGVSFIVLYGYKLIPIRSEGTSQAADERYQIQDYITEIVISPDSPAIGKTMREFESMSKAEHTVLGLIRGSRKRLSVLSSEILMEKDILIVEATHNELETLVADCKLELVSGELISPELLRSEDTTLMEVVVPAGSRMDGRSAQSMHLKSRFGLNLIAMSRQGSAYKKRLRHVKFRPGDVILLQGPVNSISEVIQSLELLPIEERAIRGSIQRKAYVPIAIFIGAILLAGFRILPIQIAFTLAVVVLAITNVVPIRNLYKHVDWSIIILLGAMIPLGTALEHTGSIYIISNMITQVVGNFPISIILGLLFIITMSLSDVMNNAATTVVMAPIAVSIGQALNVSIDPFLMTVAIAASCSFLTPISHQNNTLVMGPGGYRFFDYMRLGLPVEILVMLVSLPLILTIWPI